MSRRIKDWIKGLAGRFGVVLFKRSTGIYVDERETPAIALRLLGKGGATVIDGGAHEGAFADAVLALDPQARVVCLEPDPTLAGALQARFGSSAQVRIVPKALGETPGRARLNINASRSCNSLVEASATNSGTLGQLMKTADHVDVDVVRLDDALDDLGVGSCDLIKFDLQGFDLPALKGARRALGSAAVVIVEVWFAPVYSGTVNYLDIFAFMKEQGFALYSLIGVHYSTRDRLLWCDAVFVRADSPALAARIEIG